MKWDACANRIGFPCTLPIDQAVQGSSTAYPQRCLIS